MANLILTALCNRSCKFCFAQSRLTDMKKDRAGIHMPYGEVVRVLDAMDISGEKLIGLLGGEPTLHPNFVDIVREAQRRGFQLKIFSNLIMTAAKVDFLAGLPRGAAAIIANVTDFEQERPAQQAKREYALRQLGRAVTLGVTISSPDFSYRYLIDFILRYDLNRRIRIGVSQPIVGRDNAFLDPADYPRLGPALVKMAKACIAEDIVMGFDCGMTLCMFTQEELGVMMTHTEGFKSVCGPIIDIGPGREMWHCFPLSEIYRTPMDNFANRRKAVDYYKKVFAPYRSLGCRPECLACPYMRRGQCSGGCLAHAINSMNRKPPQFVAEQMLP